MLCQPKEHAGLVRACAHGGGGERLDHAFQAIHARAFDEQPHAVIGAGDERDRERRGIGEPLATGAKALNRSHRQRAGCKKPFDALGAREGADLRMACLRKVAKLGHVPEHEPFAPIKLRAKTSIPARTELGLAL
jgi:hypothetical protein